MANKTLMPPKIRPNIGRQMILIVLALAGIGIGYGIGFVFKKDSPKPASVSEASQPTVKDTLPQSSTAMPALILPETDDIEGKDASISGKIRAYEEALPDNIVEAVIPPLFLSSQQYRHLHSQFPLGHHSYRNCCTMRNLIL